MKSKVWIILAAAVAAGLLILAACKLSLTMNPRSACRRDAEQNGVRLAALAEQWQGEFVTREHDAYGDFAALLQLEMTVANLRDPECAVLSFRSWHPETSVHLCHCPADCYEMPDGQAVTAANGELRTEGLGMGGRGYILCVRVAEGWFYVEQYLPT